MPFTEQQIDFLVDCCDAIFRNDYAGKSDLPEPLGEWLRTAYHIAEDPEGHYTATLDGIQDVWEMALYLGIVMDVDEEDLKNLLSAKFVMVSGLSEGDVQIFVGADSPDGPEFITTFDDVDKTTDVIDDPMLNYLFSTDNDVATFLDGHSTKIDIAVVVSPAKSNKGAAVQVAQVKEQSHGS